MTLALQFLKQWLSISICLSTTLLLLVGMPSLGLADHSSWSNDHPPYTGNRAGGSRMWDCGNSKPNFGSDDLTCTEYFGLSNSNRKQKI